MYKDDVIKDDKLRELQLLLLDILKITDSICRSNDINYWLDGGTLLGAIRHNGFIPWDDDIDIVMPRKDYNRFIDEVSKQLPNGLEIQYYTNDINTHCSWAKIRHKYSFIKEQGRENNFDKTGLYIDIFPVDFFDEDSGFIEKKKKYNFIHKLIISENQRIIKPILKNIGYNKKIILKKLGTICLMGLTKESLYKKLYNEIDKNIVGESQGESDDIVDYGMEIPMYSLGVKYSDIFPLSEVTFEQYKFKIPNKYDKYLKHLYGENYLELPPEEERVWHNEYYKIYSNSMD